MEVILQREYIEPIERTIAFVWMDMEVSFHISKISAIIRDGLDPKDPFPPLTMRVWASASLHVHQLKYSMTALNSSIKQGTWPEPHPQILEVETGRHNGRLHEVEPIKHLELQSAVHILEKKEDVVGGVTIVESLLVRLELLSIMEDALRKIADDNPLGMEVDTRILADDAFECVFGVWRLHFQLGTFEGFVFVVESGYQEPRFMIFTSSTLGFFDLTACIHL